MRELRVLFLLVVAACGALAVPSSYQQQQQQQQEGGQVLCDIYSDCVGAYLCINGEIDTGGAGVIDLRLKPSLARVLCSAPDVCCRKPGIPPPAPYCVPGKACVDHTACDYDGNYNLAGTGNSGLAKVPLPTCLLGDVGVGVCCEPPVLDACPTGTTCLANNECPGAALDHNQQLIPFTSDYTAWSRCTLYSGSYGVCCEPPITHHEICPENGVCVLGNECVDGEAYDYTSVWAPYSAGYKFYDTCNLGGAKGICCKPKIVHLPTCPVDSICVPSALCSNGQGINHASVWNPYSQNYVYWSTCPLADGTNGVCCKPETIVHTTCPDHGLCVPAGQCPGKAQSYLGPWNPYSADYLYWSTCTDAAGSPGICCQPDNLIIDTCPDNSVCTTGNHCDGNAYDYTRTWAPYSASYRYWGTCTFGGVSGICCEPKIQHYDTCPDHALCVADGQCPGEGYDYTKSWNPFSSSHRFWGTCPLAGGGTGICCIPTITPTQCPPKSVCIPGAQCLGQSYDYKNTLIPYNQAYRYWATCSTPLSSDGNGICCQLPVATECGVSNAPQPHPHGLGTKIQAPALQPNEAALGEFPWQAILFFSNYTFQCGATLLTERHVLTAAHCVDGFYPADFRIRLGEWQVNTFDEILPYYDAEISTITIHPDFKPGPVYNDIAVIELTQPVPFDYHINVPCIPDASHYKLFDGKRCITTGWGKDAFYGEYQHILKKIDLPIVPHDTCQALLRKTRLSEYFILDQSFMCAGGEENKDACKGDGGGPLVCLDTSGKYVLVGITAWGIGCGQQDIPGVYVDVAKVIDFVGDVVHGRPIPPTYYPGQSEPQIDQTQQVAPYGK